MGIINEFSNECNYSATSCLNDVTGLGLTIVANLLETANKESRSYEDASDKLSVMSPFQHHLFEPSFMPHYGTIKLGIQCVSY